MNIIWMELHGRISRPSPGSSLAENIKPRVRAKTFRATRKFETSNEPLARTWFIPERVRG